MTNISHFKPRAVVQDSLSLFSTQVLFILLSGCINVFSVWLYQSLTSLWGNYISFSFTTVRSWRFLGIYFCTFWGPNSVPTQLDLGVDFDKTIQNVWTDMPITMVDYKGLNSQLSRGPGTVVAKQAQIMSPSHNIQHQIFGQNTTSLV